MFHGYYSQQRLRFTVKTYLVYSKSIILIHLSPFLRVMHSAKWHLMAQVLWVRSSFTHHKFGINETSFTLEWLHYLPTIFHAAYQIEITIIVAWFRFCTDKKFAKPVRVFSHTLVPVSSVNKAASTWYLWAKRARNICTQLISQGLHF